MPLALRGSGGGLRVDSLYESGQFGKVGYLPGAFWCFFDGVSVSGLKYGSHSGLQGRFDILINSVANEHYIFHGLADSLRGNLEDSTIRLAKAKFI